MKRLWLICLVLLSPLAVAEKLTLEEIYAHMEINPEVEVTESLRPLIKKYNRGGEHKAIAVAFGNDGYAVGVGYDGPTEIGSSTLALQQCQQQRQEFDVIEPCEVIHLNDSLIKTGASFLSAVNDDTPTLAWSLEGSKGTVYLIGTIHILKPTLLPLPKVFDELFLKSDRVVFETNPILQTDPVRIQGIQKHIISDAKQTKKAFSRAEKKAIKKFSKRSGIPYDNIFTVVPMFGALQVSQLRTAALGYSLNTGVEMNYARQASVHGKPIIELELPQDVMAAIVDFPIETQVRAFMSSLTQVEETQSRVEEILEYWLRGEEEQVYELTQEQLQTDPDAKELGKRLLDDRNVAWFPKIESFLHQEGTTVVMVGAAHMGGDQGILSLLKKAGYNPRQFSRGGTLLEDHSTTSKDPVNEAR